MISIPSNRSISLESKVVWGEALDVMARIEPVKLIFMDPPDNNGTKYSGVRDDRPDYYHWLYRVIEWSLIKAQVVWISYNVVHDLEIKHMLRDLLKLRHGGWSLRMFVWYFTFGHYNDKDATHEFRPIIRLTNPIAKLFPDSIRIPSERMLLGDKRAAGPKIPGDVWEIPRVVGNANERKAWHPTQHPLELLERIIRFSTNDFENVFDPFCGTGTTLRASLRLGRNCVTSDLSREYCERVALDTGVPLWGLSE